MRHATHAVTREDRADGSVILRSGRDLPEHPARITDWLDRWAAEAPLRDWMGERSGEGWRAVPYGEARERARAVAAWLLAEGIRGPVMILSGNSVDHALLHLGAAMVGVAVMPVAEAYSLLPEAHGRLRHLAGLARPDLVWAEAPERFGAALALDCFGGVRREAGPLEGIVGAARADVDAAAARVGPDAVVKILATSGSTSEPKGVETTHRMMAANQAQVRDAFPFLGDRPPVLTDWLPWNHVFGGSHDFNLALANGGTLWIDRGRPAPALIGETVRALLDHPPTAWFNVPVGFALVRDAMREDASLREAVFGDLDMLFYAGASLPAEVWRDLEAMAREVRGDAPLFTSSWGLTETAPAVLAQMEPGVASGVVGVPMAGTEVKLVPLEGAEERWDVRVRGPQVFGGYLGDAARTAEAFDDEGFFVTGDAMRMVDAGDASRGLRFDGRLGEEFKLSTGTWVRAAALRLAVLGRLEGLAADVVICGADRDCVGALVFPAPGAACTVEAVRAALAGQPSGSAQRVARVAVADAPPSLGDGEVTPKGNLNPRRVLQRRAALVERMWTDDGAIV